MKKILLIALILRLVCLFVFRNVNNYDLQSYLQVGKLTLNKVNIYPTVANLHHPYLPFYLYLEALSIYLKKFSVDPVIFLKLVNIIFDLGITYLVYLLSKKNKRTALIYAFNPVSILIFTLHGQFDAIPIFFLLLSIYLMTIKKELFSILVYSFGVMTKIWPLLFIMSFYKRLRNKKLILLVSIFPIISVFVYSILFRSSFISIGKTIANYQGLWGIWGIWALLGKWRIRWQKLSTLIFLVCFFIYSWLNKKRNIVKEILNLLFFFFIFTSNFSLQYFSWLMPFLIIKKPKGYKYLIFFITIMLISYYICWIRPISLPLFQEIWQFFTWVVFIKTWTGY